MDNAKFPKIYTTCTTATRACVRGTAYTPTLHVQDETVSLHQVPSLSHTNAQRHVVILALHLRERGASYHLSTFPWKKDWNSKTKGLAFKAQRHDKGKSKKKGQTLCFNTFTEGVSQCMNRHGMFWKQCVTAFSKSSKWSFSFYFAVDLTCSTAHGRRQAFVPSQGLCSHLDSEKWRKTYNSKMDGPRLWDIYM